MRNSIILCLTILMFKHVLVYFLVEKFFGQLNFKIISVSLLFSLFLLYVGLFILYFRLKADQFVGRFMMTTLFQMLGVLSFVLALIYLKIQPIRFYALLFVGVYILGMIIQTSFVIRMNNRMN